MADKYEYHKQNDYPGERVAERKRVSDNAEIADNRSDARVAEKGRSDGLKADNRVARRGRMDDELMDSEIQRSTARAQRVNRARNNTDAIALIVVAGLLVILLVGLGWSYAAIRQQSSEISSLKQQLANAGVVQLANVGNQNAAADTTLPRVLSVAVLPANNERNVSRDAQITVVFSKDMDPSTINADIVTVMQRSTPESGPYRSIAIDGAVTYANRRATFIAKDLFAPGQQYGNVFTVTISTGAKDLAGKSLAQSYVWSFTTGGDAFNTGKTTSQTN